MFAAAFFDPRDKRLVLARDQFGKKPMFLRRLDSGLLFASEPKAILAYGGRTPELDLESVADFLCWRYVPGPNTLFSDIKKLPPGSWAVWSGRSLDVTRYFVPPYAEDAMRDEPPDPVGAFMACLDDAVRLRMASDVPFGAFLSGGLDSSAIVALMSRHSSEAIRTFSVGFKEAEHSELPYARLVAERFKTYHTELVISADDLMQHLPFLVEKSDGPVSEPSNIPIWLISKKARESVKMVLTGEGSDELLGGYPKHSAERFGAIWRSTMPSPIRRHVIGPALRALPFGYRRIKILAASVDLDSDAERMPRWMGALTAPERDRLLNVRSGRRLPDPDLFKRGRGRTAMERILLFDQLSWLPDNLLERGDRMTMAASIEARMPFMDTVLAKLVAGFGDRWRIRGFTSKYILRQAMKDVLPAEVLSRPKVGFRVPVDEWFRSSMRDYLHGHLDSAGSLTRELYSRAELARILSDHEQGVQNNEKLLWSLLNLELFQKRYRLAAPAGSACLAEEPRTLVA